MKRHPILLGLLLASACERQQEPAQRHVAQSNRAPSAPAAPNMAAASRAAARQLGHYYALIEAGDYRAAYRLRTAGGAELERFERNFASYERYRALVGAPSPPVAADNFVYVQIPVMITGRFVGGKPFGNSGNVMMRRPASATDRDWKILADR